MPAAGAWAWILVPAATVVFVETQRQAGITPPIPFLLLYASVVLTANRGGSGPGLVAAAGATAFITYAGAMGFGPGSLTGGVPQIVLGGALHAVTAWLIGRATDTNVRLVLELRERGASLEREVARRARRLERMNDELKAEIGRREGAEARMVRAEVASGTLRGELDDALCWLRVPPGLAELVGRDVARGEPFLELVAPDDRGAVAERLLKVPLLRREVRLLGADGAAIWVHLTSGPVEQDGEQGVVLWLRDRSEAKAREAVEADLRRQLQQSQRLESLGVMAGGIAHDFNNLLTPILGNGSLLETTLPEGGPDHGLAVQISSAARQAGGLVQQMLTYAGRAPTGDPDCVDLAMVVGSITELVRASLDKSVELQLQVGPGLCVMGHSTQLAQVVLNLCTNAADALDGEGRIVLQLSRGPVDTQDWLGEGVGGTRPMVVLRVADNGSGMSPEVVQRVFEPFFSTKDQSRGLGLAVVFGVVRSHGGAVRITSVVGEGTTFEIAFPEAEVELAAGDADATAPSVGATGRVLVIDDEPAIRLLARRILERNGFEVGEASNGEAGIRMVMDEPSKWSVVVVDLSMPGMRGDDVMGVIRAHSNVPMVLMSGYPTGLMGPDDEPVPFLQKPFDIRRLLEAVQAQL